MTWQKKDIAYWDPAAYPCMQWGRPNEWAGVLYGTAGNCDPYFLFAQWTMTSVEGPTPNEIGTSLARCVQFTPPVDITVARVRLFGIAATASKYKFAIYPAGTGSSLLWESGAVTSASNAWLNVSAALPVTLLMDTEYWFCVTAADTGGTAGFRSPHASVGSAFWGADVAPIGGRGLLFPVFAEFTLAVASTFPATLPAVAAASYADADTGTVPFAFLDSVA